MKEQELRLQLPTPRELVRPLFRYRAAVTGTFLLAMMLTLAFAASLPRVYVAEMKLLIKRERLDSIVTSDARASATPPADITETELNSAVELLKSRDLLERVVAETGLADADRPKERSPSPDSIASAAIDLRDSLDVWPVRRTTLIHVAYGAPDPQLAARVLDRLAALYLEKHLAVQRPAGAHQFFTEQATRLQQELRRAQDRLRAFNEKQRVVSARDEKASALRLLSESESGLQQTEAAIADAERRLDSVQVELQKTPDREVTQTANAANVQLVRELRSKILDVQIKRNDLLQRFTPAYPPVMRLQEELDQLQEALTAAEAAPLRNETVERNPTYQWLRNEVARVKTEHAALVARGAETRRAIAAYRERAQRLESVEMEQQQLINDVKAAEENFLLYQRKQEESRIGDALDRTRIANVAIAEAPTVPQRPAPRGRLRLLLAGSILSFGLAFGVAFLLHAANPCFRTPDDVYEVLDVPVLASLPAKSE
jgi:succinoglycan biosynthesis transport protein ExoP